MAVAFIVVAVSSLVLAAVIINVSVNRQFGGYLRRTISARDSRIVDAIAESYTYYGGWSFLPALRQYSRVNNVIVEVFDAAGTRLFDSRAALRGWGRLSPPGLARQGVGNTYPLIVDSTRIGSVRITSLGREGLLSAQDILFRRAVIQSILRAAVLAALLAVLLAVVFSRQIVRPLRRITDAANRLASGDLGASVPVETQDEVGELAETLNVMSRRLSQLEALRQRLTQDVAHELRTPLASTKALVEGMQDGVIPADARNLGDLAEEVERLNRLVSDLNDLSLAEGQRRLLFEPEDPMAIARERRRRLEPLFKERGVGLRVAAGPRRMILLDRPAVERVFDNLLSNALRYTPEGGEVSIEGRLEGEYYAISVSDTGVGIEPEHLPYVFERFYRADPSRVRSTGGTGIGLAIARDLMRAHGGQIEVQSTPGIGTTFTLRFPLTPPADGHPSGRSAARGS